MNPEAAFPPFLTDAIDQVRHDLRQSDGFDSYRDRDVRPACCAAYAYGDAYLRPGVDRVYVLAVAVMLRKRFAIPMTIVFDQDDPESIEALASRWRKAHVPEDMR